MIFWLNNVINKEETYRNHQQAEYTGIQDPCTDRVDFLLRREGSFYLHLPCLFHRL